MYFRQQWREPRLAYPPCDRNRTSSIRLPDNSWDKLWVPDTFFRNEKQAKFSKMTVNNRLMRLNSTGMVWYVSRYAA
jgi:Neurotransmitter-gated ion-channel ligand binding domain